MQKRRCNSSDKNGPVELCWPLLRTRNPCTLQLFIGLLLPPATSRSWLLLLQGCGLRGGGTCSSSQGPNPLEMRKMWSTGPWPLGAPSWASCPLSSAFHAIGKSLLWPWSWTQESSLCLSGSLRSDLNKRTFSITHSLPRR